MSAARSVPDWGVGLGLRVPHYSHILKERPSADFFEIISENFMVEGGKARYHLSAVRETYRVLQHGVSLNIGGPEPLDFEYLKRLKALVKETATPWVSDHFCWCGAGGAHVHDLLPLPYTEEAVQYVSARARMVQDFLEVPFALENTSSYLAYRSSTLTEWAFIREVVERADIGLLLDCNNVYVAAYNHGIDPLAFVEQIPHERVLQIHLASHTNVGPYLIDTHRGQVIEAVWALYRRSIELCGSVSTLIEWDDEIPAFEVLAAEATRAKSERARALVARAAGTSSVVSAEIQAALLAARSQARSSEHGWQQGGPRETASQTNSGNAA